MEGGEGGEGVCPYQAVDTVSSITGPRGVGHIKVATPLMSPCPAEDQISSGQTQSALDDTR